MYLHINSAIRPRSWTRWYAGLVVLFVALLGNAVAADTPDEDLIRAAGMTPYPVPLKGPAFRLSDRSGQVQAKQDYHGRVVLLNFWGSWCPPCREEFPSLERLQKRIDRDDFTVLAVTVSDTADGVERFLKGHAVPFDVLIDTSDRTADAYRAAGVPVTYLLDRQGRLIAGKAGPRAWDDPAVIRLIRAALENASPDNAAQRR